jgi:hypothetical protein
MRTIIDGLRDIPSGKDDYRAYLEELLGGAPEVEEPAEVFPHAFRFFETHADADLGLPGPLVHYLERFYPAYLDELCESVTRKPITYTLWMVNRILNLEISEPLRDRLQALLRRVADDLVADDAARQEARNFLTHQEERRPTTPAR